MHFGPPLVADEQALEVVQPGEGALDDPTDASQPGTMLSLSPGYQWGDPQPPKLLAMAVRVVATVADERVGPPARAPDHSAHAG